MSDEILVFLHGAGQRPSAWNGVISHLPAGRHGVALALPTVGRDVFRLDAATDAVHEQLELLSPGRVVLVGLSLGATVAARVAAAAPERVAALVLSGGQVRASRGLSRLEIGAVRAVPAAAFTPFGMRKRRLLSELRAFAAADLSEDLPRIEAPALVLCGSLDRPNLPGARALAAGIPGARLRVVPRVGHAWNLTHPRMFARVLADV